MKNTRRIAIFALALILALALAVPAFAADPVGGSITVTGATLADPNNYTVYTVYKMLSVADGNTADENKYTVDSNWHPFVTGTGMDAYFEVREVQDDGTYVIWVKNTTSAADAAAIAELAREYVAENPAVGTATKVGEVTVNGSALDIPTNGYYLLVPDNTTASGVVVVKNGKAVEITEKSVAPGMPKIEKLVYEDSIQGYATSNTVDVGNAFNYKVTITAGQGASHYILHDVMDEHIHFVDSTVKVTRGGHPVADTYYDVVTTGLTDGCTFHIEFHDNWCAELNQGAVIVVTYDGILQGEKVGEVYEEVDTDTAHENTAWLTHTPANVETDKTTVSTRTYEINVVKHDQNGLALEGAGFVLRNNENKYYKYENGVVDWVDNIDAATELFSDENGKLRFYGVDAEIFQLVEHTVPGGYTGVELTQANTKTGNVKDGDLKVVNTLGQKLPETGGIGTTVFYIGGVVLVLCALAALVVIKRKETSAQ